ncbi:hypothetical protein [Actinomadura rupiterrae]|uniref:hypothetical protein n=1 Tax=Actinomadura rupiterrae TaxID=559627 RepID=UPI0020A3BFD6|nr:hypothetical protein [Actinomadura rupiterrae]MCP2338781.1 hypothetical protein [Actinomadura rupiterrae]
MTGDMGRPEFLPPEEEPRAPAPGPGPELPARPARRRRAGTLWSVLTVLSAGTLLVSAFLPWARLEMLTELLGATVSDDLGSVAGIELDGTIVVVPVLALAAAALALWGSVGRDARIGSLAALPGALALVACVLFALRLGRASDHFNDDGALLASRTHATLAYGWYLGVAASLLVVGFSLARPVAVRARGRVRSRTAVAEAPEQP